MSNDQTEHRSMPRQQRDAKIAAEPPLQPPRLPADAPCAPVEAHLDRQRPHPIAVTGIVENGVVRPIDPAVKLPEHARVIIVAAEKS